MFLLFRLVSEYIKPLLNIAQQYQVAVNIYAPDGGGPTFDRLVVPRRD
jgi:hypothetical protein